LPISIHEDPGKLPAKPILRVKSEAAAVETVEAVLIRIGRGKAHNALVEELVYLYADFGLNLVVPVVAFGVEH
jgi:hypothetical protein